MENSFKSIIDKAKSVLILLPTKPSFDQVAAGLSLFLTLRQEKQIQITSPTPMTVEFNKLIGVNKVTSELGDKNMVIRFSDYKADNIERVSYDIEQDQFRLTVIPKAQVNPPVKEQVQISYSGVAADTVIIIGGANESRFPAISSEDLASADLVHIGTRDITLSSNKTFISFSRPASSVSEVIYSLIKKNNLNFSPDIATNLLMGIEKGSKDLTDSQVNAETFSAVSELMAAGGKRSGQVTAAPKAYPPGAIPGQMPPMTQAQAMQYRAQLQQQMLRQQAAYAQQAYPQPQYPAEQSYQPGQYQQLSYQLPSYDQQQPSQYQPSQQSQDQAVGQAGQSVQAQAQQPQTQQLQKGSNKTVAKQEADPEKIEKKEDKDDVPQDWLLEPRIYKGTSV